MHPSTKRGLTETMGLREMTEVQARTFEHVVSGKSLVARARTGTKEYAVHCVYGGTKMQRDIAMFQKRLPMATPGRLRDHVAETRQGDSPICSHRQRLLFSMKWIACLIWVSYPQDPIVPSTTRKETDAALLGNSTPNYARNYRFNHRSTL